MDSAPAPPRTPAATLTHVTCAYGGTGPAPPDYVAIVLLFEIATVREISTPRVVNIDILDGSGASVARAIAPIGLRVALPGGAALDYSESNSTPLARPIAANAKVRLRAAASLTPLRGAYSTKLRYRASLATEEGAAPLVLEGPLDNPWATAGPAPSR